MFWQLLQCICWDPNPKTANGRKKRPFRDLAKAFLPKPEMLEISAFGRFQNDQIAFWKFDLPKPDVVVFGFAKTRNIFLQNDHFAFWQTDLPDREMVVFTIKKRFFSLK